ncbi:TetR/AcrR family transcriptional regulator [Hoyosella subflava]|uniref:TetR/AcrR family transcriptional regulator n=1 Tax=Hoyosella subflava TaxID=639313 RepID=UPI001ED8CA5C|nr:TetR/AcrR family transcriptional regulator [Hoyosella subflava]
MIPSDSDNGRTSRRSSGRRAGRPATKVLTPEKIVAAALDVIEVSGDRGLTISALAKRLGVAPSALYNHVSSKRDLLILVQDDVIERIDYGCFETLPWADAVRQWARSSRDVFATHGHLIPIYAVIPVTNSRAILRMYETVAKGFLAAGWHEGDIVHAIVSIESFVLGSAMDANAPEDMYDIGDLSTEFPVFSSVVAGTREDASGRADVAFEIGLEGLIAGLEVWRSRQQ